MGPRQQPVTWLDGCTRLDHDFTVGFRCYLVHSKLSFYHIRQAETTKITKGFLVGKFLSQSIDLKITGIASLSEFS